MAGGMSFLACLWVDSVLTWLLPRDWWFSFCPRRQKGWSSPLGLPSKSPQERGIQHKNVGSSGEGIGFLPLGHPMVGTSQSSWFVSPFPDVSRGPQGQQEATQNLCLELWLRGHLGDILGQCLPGLG